METIEFWKMNGSGNDFILIDNMDGKINAEDMGRVGERICRRRESVGADGIIYVIRSERYDFAWRYFNADGGEVEMCGNGGRCVARFAHLKGIAGPKMTFETLAGPIEAEVTGRVVKELMPDPTGMELDIGLAPDSSWRSVDYVNTGVPHVVAHVDDLEDYPVFEKGRAIRYHEKFSPAGTNANFVKMIDAESIIVRTYERGVEDETLACGTGAIASTLVGAARGKVRSPVRVRTWGGEDLIIHFERDGHEFKRVWLEGNTAIAYVAELNEEAL
jgi:diaminopimelate epimerase